MAHPMRDILVPAGVGTVGDIHHQDYYYSEYTGTDDPIQVVHHSYIQPLMQLLASLDTNTSVDLARPHLRKIFRNHSILTVVIILYCVLILLGLLGNLLLLIMLIRKRLYRDPIQCCVLSVVTACLIQLLLTLPLSLFVLLVHNWLLGKFFCFILPMIQDLPSYVIMLSLLALSIDRYLILTKPHFKRFPIHIVLPMVWVLSLAMVLPYMAYISHFYLDDLGPGFEGGEFCVVNLEGQVAVYMRVLFFLLFIVPVILCLVLMMMVWFGLADIQTKLAGFGLADSLPEGEEENLAATNRSSQTESLRNINNEDILGRERSKLSDLDINKETRTQKFLLLILISHFICILPINILKMVTHVMTETYDNDSHFDLTYIITVWITFLPTVTLPWFYAHWILIGSLSRVLLVELFISGSPRQMAEMERKQRLADQERIFAHTISHSRRGEGRRLPSQHTQELAIDTMGQTNSQARCSLAGKQMSGGSRGEQILMAPTAAVKASCTSIPDTALIVSTVQYRRSSLLNTGGGCK